MDPETVRGIAIGLYAAGLIMALGSIIDYVFNRGKGYKDFVKIIFGTAIFLAALFGLG